MAAEPRLSDANLEALCGILRDTGTGLTGSEIGRFLRECDVDDPCGRPAMTQINVSRTGPLWARSASRPSTIHSRNICVIVVL